HATISEPIISTPSSVSPLQSAPIPPQTTAIVLQTRSHSMNEVVDLIGLAPSPNQPAPISSPAETHILVASQANLASRFTSTAAVTAALVVNLLLPGSLLAAIFTSFPAWR